MRTHLPMFTLRLSAGYSVGHVALRQIWLQASRSRDVSVSRTLLAQDQADNCVYTLSGTRQIEDLAAVENRLRELIAAQVCRSRITLTRLC